MTPFKDRYHAGKLLADKLKTMDLGMDICVLALPRGGVPVAWEVALRLKCPLDLFWVKKIGVPYNEELAIAAISETDIVWRQEAIDYLNLDAKELESLARLKQRELDMQLARWRKGREPVSIKGKVAIVVDDGIATGASMTAALISLHKMEPQKIIVAAPVASKTTLEGIKKLCDEAVVLETPADFHAVGQYYHDFTQVTDSDVEKILLERPDPKGVVQRASPSSLI